MRRIVPSVAVLCLGLAGCAGGVPFGARAVSPPETGIRAALLYTTPERAGSSSSGPVSLSLLCNVPDSILTSIAYQSESSVADIDLLSTFSASGGITGVQLSAVSAELQGSFSSYYELKLTGVTKRYVSQEEANAVFSRLVARQGCANAYAGERAARAVYQVRAIYVGDVHFGVKRDAGFSADLTAKLKALEPKIKAQLKRAYNLSFNGTKMVGAVETIPR
ncbi:hypothetical protein ABLE93_03355 [Xanthobacter sp. KR7-65]|uniref:hypothetical protein n=1 Tax=Xanthobacter sp. KR7-65 TaxID=3156612 RepID=UPI0032B3D0A1